MFGFVLEGDPSLQADIIDSTLARIPVIGAQLDDEVAPPTGSALGLAVGLAGALWAGLGVTLALGRAFQELWDVPRLDQRGPIRSRAYGVAALVVLAAVLVGSAVLSGLAIGGGIGPAAERLGALSLALVVNAAVFLAVFGLLTQRPVVVRELLPGVALASVGSMILQSVGGWYFDRTVTGAGDTYGTFALVIGLLSWFWLGSHLLLLAAEANVVLHRRLWPRALAGDLEPADRVALRCSAEAGGRCPQRRHLRPLRGDSARAGARRAQLGACPLRAPQPHRRADGPGRHRDVGDSRPAPDPRFLGWFGPRGLASIVFARIVVEESQLPHEDLIVLAIYLTVGLSVFAHGLSAAPPSPTATPAGMGGIRTTRPRRWRAHQPR